MINIAEEAPITYEQFMAMERVEIINGEVVEMNAAGAIHAIIRGNVLESLSPYVKPHQLGIVFGDGMTFLMVSGLPRLKDSYVPDVSFITADNISADWDMYEAHPGVPDFAVEIVSPNDRAETLKTKLDTYLNNGTQEVWGIFPKLGKLEQHWRENGEDRSVTYIDGTILSRVLPGWAITHEAVFSLPTWVRRQGGL